MDIGKLLKNVNSLNEYISITHDTSEECRTSRIQLNLSTVLALKKIRSLEIEYFNKCEENGIACVIFERMLNLPPAKTWGVLSKELVNLLQYWLDAIRKHLVRHNLQWWSFLKLLLRFIKEICHKDSSLPNILVEYISECLLDLASNSRPDATQKHEILHCFNLYCSESSREIRYALRNKFGQYFVKLSTYMASCGYLPTQYSIMETLLRWLLPRQDRTLRAASAAKWFPLALYAEPDVGIFLERPWVNFFQDARDFLNAHNERQSLITSVVCRKLTVGKVVVISGTERQESWLDINSANKSLTVLMDPRVLETFGSTNHKSFETLVITDENTETAKLHRQSQQLLVSVRTGAPPRLLPSGVSLGGDVDCDVTAHVTSRSDVTKIDNALRSVFDDKYQIQVDLDKVLELSPLKADQAKNSEQDSRFSHPVEVKRRTHSGYMVKSRQNLACMSPSTASTSSLAQLHDKLAALPRYKYDKEPVSVCAHPELSIVTEYSEADDKQSANTTLKFKPYGVCQKDFNKLDSRKSQSDPECSRKSKGRRLSPVINEDTTSCLLVATIGSADDSVINDTVERLSKSKDYNPDNIVDLLVQEALQAREKTDKIDSGINTGEKKSDLDENSEAIENTPNVDEIKINKVQHKPSKILSSTSDESNTEAINETSCYVNTRRKIKKNTPKTDPINKQSFDEQVVEEFFSQHFTKNKETREIIISPTLAKKINETSSESSDHFGDNFNLIAEDIEEDIVPYDFNNIEVLECLNSMVDKVCDVFDKCTKYLNEDEITADPEENMPLQDIINTIQDMESKNKNTSTKSISKKSIKLKYKVTPKRGKSRAAKRKNKLELEPTSKMSTIIEDAGLESAAEKTVDIVTSEPPETVANKEKSEVFCNDAEQASTSVQTAKKDLLNDVGDLTTPQLRRKRKLYSPKDEQLAEETYDPEEPVQSNTKIKKTPKSTATCYKEIEKDRKKHLRMPRTRRAKKAITPSPRTKKMNDIFDKLKESANNEKVTLADKTFEVDVYNFTSDSDDDFKEKKIEISKRNSTTTVASFDSAASRRRRAVKRIDYTDYRSSDESNKVKRKVNRKPRTKKKVSIERNELVDERLRKAKDKDVLNSSIVVEKSKTVLQDPDFFIERPPEMEVIKEQGKQSEGSQKKKGKKNVKTETEPKKSKRILSKTVVEVVKNFDEDRTESPLPGLLVEPDAEKEDDVNELSSTMVDKFKKIYQEGPEKYVNESNTTQNLLSDIERINYSTTVDGVTEELIQIDDQINKSEQENCVKNKKNTFKAKIIKKEKKRTSNTSNKQKGDVITMLEISDAKSERSIETIGITGHGELEEAPPSPKLIRERLEPRNLEVDDLDHSMKDYFNKLTKQMNESNNRDSSSNSENKDESIVKSISPVVSVKRLSSEDISRWLPSRRNSESDDSYASAKSIKQTENVKNSVKTKSDHNESHSDVSAIIKTKRESLRLLYKNTSKLENSQSKKYEDSDSECSIKSPRIQTRSRKTKVEAKKNEKPEVVKKQTSLISPIKLFDDLISNAEKQSESTLSDDEEYMKEIIHTLSKQKASQSPKLKPKTTSPRYVKQKTLKSIDFAEQKSSKSIDTLSSHSKISTSTKIDDSRRLKRKSGEDRDDYKKKRVEVNNNECVSGSGVTVSSVDEWFKKIEPEGSREEIISASFKHSVQNVMEKLDTTLVEIHRNTSKKFAHLFVDAQKHLSELKEQRRGMYKRLASDILTEVVKIMDDKFADLDKRSQDLDGDFMKILKERTSELIREDCKQKRALVQLLREDVQAVADYMERGHS